MGPVFLLAAAAGLRLTAPSGEPVTVPVTGQPATVVLFVSTVCPVSNDYADRYEALHARARGQGVRLVFVYSNKTESLDDIRRHVREGRYPYPVHRDAGNVVADRFGALVTPTAVVLDAAGVVRYRGQIDDSANAARVTARPLEDAISAVLAGKPVSVPETRAFG